MPGALEVLNLPEFESKMAGVSERIAAPLAPVGEPIFHELEAEEEGIFSGYGGKYVRTGALRESLTATAGSGAVRRLLPTELVFGSAIPYAQFQGTTGKGRHRPPSAIAHKIDLGQVAALERVMMEYILRGLR